LKYEDEGKKVIFGYRANEKNNFETKVKLKDRRRYQGLERLLNTFQEN